MIKKIKSRLSVKVFLITALLMAVCCMITYMCIARFAPYIYTHDLSEVEETADILSVELYDRPMEEAPYILSAFNEILTQRYDNEFVIHIFQSTGEEITLPQFNALTGKVISDYQNTQTTEERNLLFADSTEEYRLFLTKNTAKESQIIEALQKSLPAISIVILLVSVITSMFYTWYITKPIKKISRLSEQMAELDFSGRCPAGRTDEIGILSNSLHTLSSKLSAALTELQSANRKLKADIDRERQLEQQRTSFFSAASHELKTPVTIIKGQLQGMLYQVGRYQDRETWLARSLEVTDQLERMIQELLTVSRLDTPGYTFQPACVHLTDLLHARLTANEDLFVQRELTVEQDISPDVCVSGDLRLLEKAADNLLTNAAVYTPPGERVTVKLWHTAEKAYLTIENTGVHIPDSDIPKLFDAFYRVDPSRNRQTGGTGLGLYIVKTILDLHGAAVKIESTAQGVKVSVEF